MTRSRNWPTVAFGDVVRLNTDRVADPAAAGIERYVGIEHITPEDLRIRSWGLVAEGTTFTNHFRPGQVLFAKRRAYQRKVALADFEGVCSGDIYVLESKNPDVLLPDLLPFICQTDGFFNHAVDTSAGSLSPRTNWSQLAAYEFPLPPPAEQRRLVEVLLAYETVIEANNEAFKKVTQLIRATLRQVFTYGLYSNRQLVNVDTQYSRMPSSWSIRSLGEITDFLDSQRVPLKSADRAKRKGAYPYYGASGIIDYIDDYLFDEDLILLSEDGANLIDRNYPVAFIASGKYWVNNHAHVLRVRTPHSTIYLTEYLESLNFRPYITGTAQPKLNKNSCLDIPVPIPTNNEEHEIADLLSEIRQASHCLRDRLAKAKRQKELFLRSYLS